MTAPLTLEILQRAVKEGAALRWRARLQPAGGQGDKVFPPTYEGGEYALESRVIDGRRVPCVLLDSVQSQANRMEAALLEAHRTGSIHVPLVEVRFEGDLAEVGVITSLDAPHRLADAILRDSRFEGKRFRETDAGKVLDHASLANCAPLFGICPTALVFGLWDSTGPLGGLGTKFQRAVVGELVGVDIEKGCRPSSRIDPLGIQKNAGPIFRTPQGDLTLDPKEALQVEGKPVLFARKSTEGKSTDVAYTEKTGALPDEGRPSKANHGNVTPSLKNEQKQPHHGGVTLDHALHTVVVSLPALRRLRFPLDGGVSPDLEARTALAALAVCAATLSVARGCDLRSRCLLVPEPLGAGWELVGADGALTPFTLSADAACALLNSAVAAAIAAKLPWRQEPLILKPSSGLTDLVRKSRELTRQGAAEGA
jgi:CRISPR-associated protein Csb1